MGTGSTGSAPWLADSVSHEEHLTGLCLVLTRPSSELSVVALFFIIPYSFRSLLKKFGNFSQQVVTVEKWFNLFCKRTLGSPQFWHFSSPNPLGLKPIDYEGLVSHIEGLSQCLVSVSVGPF